MLNLNNTNATCSRGYDNRSGDSAYSFEQSAKSKKTSKKSLIDSLRGLCKGYKAPIRKARDIFTFLSEEGKEIPLDPNLEVTLQTRISSIYVHVKSENLLLNDFFCLHNFEGRESISNLFRLYDLKIVSLIHFKDAIFIVLEILSDNLDGQAGVVVNDILPLFTCNFNYHMTKLQMHEGVLLICIGGVR